MSSEPLSDDELPVVGDMPLVSLLESLLFVADSPVTLEQLAKALERSVEEVETGLRTLAQTCISEQRGLRLQRRNSQIQMVTAPAAAQAVESFLNLDLSARLSGPALEILAIIAYRQPVARAQIEAVRGVDCAGVLRKLLQHGLIEKVGRLETVGRPILYGVTDLFLQHFGMTGLDELPPLPEEDADDLEAALALAVRGEWRVAGGGWRVASSGWQVAGGEGRVTARYPPPACFINRALVIHWANKCRGLVKNRFVDQAGCDQSPALGRNDDHRHQPFHERSTDNGVPGVGPNWSEGIPTLLWHHVLRRHR